MTFRPDINYSIAIDNTAYRVAEHPAAPGVAYGQEGRAGIVYQVMGPHGRDAMQMETVTVEVTARAITGGSFV